MQFIQDNFMWVALAVISGVMLLLPNLRGRGATLSPSEATLLINREDALVLDVREPGEYAQGHIPNAKLVPSAKLAERLGEFEKFKDRPVIVNCATGNRSGSACGVLRKAGFSKVYNLAGGIGGWQQAGLPVTRKQ